MATMPRARSTPRVKKPAPPMEATPMIGEEGSGGYVSCPKCGRPVADGLVRCSGCGTRILLGVAASRALLFLTTGAVLGLLVGGLSVGSILNASRAPAPAAAPAGAVHPDGRAGPGRRRWCDPARRLKPGGPAQPESGPLELAPRPVAGQLDVAFAADRHAVVDGCDQL